MSDPDFEFSMQQPSTSVSVCVFVSVSVSISVSVYICRSIYLSICIYMYICITYIYIIDSPLTWYERNQISERIDSHSFLNPWPFVIKTSQSWFGGFIKSIKLAISEKHRISDHGAGRNLGSLWLTLFPQWEGHLMGGKSIFKDLGGIGSVHNYSQ